MSDDGGAAGAAKAAKDRRTRTIEIIEVAVLSIVAIATAWSGYQGTKWGGRQSMLYAQASSIRLQADETGTRAGQVLVADATIFTAWLQAHHAGDRSLEAELARRFSPEYASAFHDWLGTDPFTDPNAPAGPAAMPAFTTARSRRPNHAPIAASVASQAAWSVTSWARVRTRSAGSASSATS